jgi:putative ABC transport system ATP-binding protein
MAGILELHGVARHYVSAGQRVDALLAADVRIGHGDYVAITGPSGSGKSTMLHLMGLLARPSCGRVLVDGVDTTTLADPALSSLRAAAVGFVFQAFHLLPRLTALENVELPLVYGRISRRERRARALDGLARVGLEARAYSLPTELSGGQRQRVAIARAIVRRPLAVLCDEPTGNLDSTAARRISSLLDELHADGMAVVVATHDLPLARRAQRLVTVSDGLATEIAERDDG